MRNRRLILIALIAVIILEPFSPLQHLYAQGPILDFTISDQGFTVSTDTLGGPFGSYSLGTGFVPNCEQHYGPPTYWNMVTAALPLTGQTITHITIYYDISPGGSVLGTGPTIAVATDSSFLINDSSTGSGSQTRDWDGSVTTSNLYITLVAGTSNDSCAAAGGSGAITKLVITTTSNSPTAATTFTNCPLLGIANANFTSLPGNWTLTGDAAQAEGETSGLQFGIGSASLTLSLNPTHNYSIVVNWDNPTSDAARFTVGLGANPTIPISAAATTTGTYTTPSQMFNPGTPGGDTRSLDGLDSAPNFSGPNFYSLVVSRNQAVPDELDRDGNPVPADPIIVKSVCVTDDTAGAVGGGTGLLGGTTATSVPAECTEGCAFHFEGSLDGGILGFIGAIPSLLQGLFDYLICGLLKWFRCVLAPALGGVWTTIQTIFYAINIVRQWIGIVWQNAGTWFAIILRIFAAFLGGTLSNIFQVILNAAYSVLNSLGLIPIINFVLAFIQSLIQGIGNFISFTGMLVQGITSLIGAVFNFVINVIALRFTELIQTILSIFSAFITSINAPAVAPPGVPVCDTSASMIPASCVGLFIIDNSILADGSVFGTILPIVQGAAGLGVLWWSVNRIKRAISNYAEAN